MFDYTHFAPLGPAHQFGPGQKSWITAHYNMSTQTKGKDVREANKRNGVGRPPRNKIDPRGNDSQN